MRSVNIYLATAGVIIALLFTNNFLIAQENNTVETEKTPIVIDLWQDGLPNTNGLESQGYDDSKRNFKPTMYVYLPKSNDKPSKAVIICPGGGYERLAIKHEGHDWADFFNEQGIAAIVLRYRMPNGNLEVPLSDAYEAIRYTKVHAKEWNIASEQIGIMGASAGGHLASSVATHATDDLMPAFQILLYPVISLDPGLTHGGSRKRFLGENPPAELEKLYSNEFQVTVKTPRAFIALSDDDTVVKPMNSVKYYIALKDAKIPAVMHIYPDGRHGWGIKASFKYRTEMLLNLKSWLNTF